jgi:hypothetical protein
MRAVKSFWEVNQQALGFYFRYLYRIFQFIDRSGIKDKGLYSGIARHQPSDPELLRLFYNCLSKHGVEVTVQTLPVIPAWMPGSRCHGWQIRGGV